jgi:hypothetical protein
MESAAATTAKTGHLNSHPNRVSRLPFLKVAHLFIRPAVGHARGPTQFQFLAPEAGKSDHGTKSARAPSAPYR